MGSLYLLDLADVCRRTGYPVIEVGGGPSQTGSDWQRRARGSGGYNSGCPDHVMIHHTASGPSADGWGDANYCTFSHTDAPLCNLYLARTGEIYVCAGGATNTNGSGIDQCGIVPDDSMNSHAIGIEAGNDGVGEPWTDVQLAAYASLCSALCNAYAIGVECVHAHWQWAPSRKVDPAGPPKYQDPPREGPAPLSWNMGVFCNDVRTCGGDTPPPQPEPEPTPPQPEPTPPPDQDFPPYPGEGDYGADYYVVRAWQDAMILNGVISNNNANHDGVWGDGMHNACFDMQRHDFNWSDADGVGGPHTWNHLRAWNVQPCPTCGQSNY